MQWQHRHKKKPACAGVASVFVTDGQRVPFTAHPRGKDFRDGQPTVISLKLKAFITPHETHDDGELLARVRVSGGGGDGSTASHMVNRLSDGVIAHAQRIQQQQKMSTLFFKKK